MRMSTVKRVLHFTFPHRRPSKGKAVDQNATAIEVCYCADEAQVHTHVRPVDPEMAVSEDELDLQEASSSSKRTKRTHHSRHHTIVRVVSWASIARGTCRRWTMEQERELSHANHELARCQKAWSSEQELWLAYIKALNEEKEAHDDFYHNRAKQQDDEQQSFRKAWNRRKSSEIREEHGVVVNILQHHENKEDDAYNNLNQGRPRRLRKSLDRYR